MHQMGPISLGAPLQTQCQEEVTLREGDKRGRRNILYPDVGTDTLGQLRDGQTSSIKDLAKHSESITSPFL